MWVNEADSNNTKNPNLKNNHLFYLNHSFFQPALCVQQHTNFGTFHQVFKELWFLRDFFRSRGQKLQYLEYNFFFMFYQHLPADRDTLYDIIWTFILLYAPRTS